MTGHPSELLQGNDLEGALAALQDQVKANPGDSKLRVFLFQLLCVMGDWNRAITQLKLCAQMDAAGIGRGFLIAAKTGRPGLPGSYHMPLEVVADAVAQYPDRFSGLVGLDPYQGMDGVERGDIKKLLVVCCGHVTAVDVKQIHNIQYFHEFLGGAGPLRSPDTKNRTQNK